MIGMQLMDPRNPDPEHIFKETMQDYCKTYDNKAAFTEDFKAIVEKHMTVRPTQTEKAPRLGKTPFVV